MRSLVVLMAVVAVARGSLVGLVAQPPHHPAVVLDPHGRPLDTAEVIGARALHLQAKALEHGHDHFLDPVTHSAVAPVAHAVVAAPTAVSHQSRVDVHHSSPAVITAHAAPVWDAPLLGHGFAEHGHWLKKRSLAYTPLVAAPALSHQSRVEVVSSPVTSHAVAAPYVAHAAPYVAHAAPLVKYVGDSAVSHQSRVDVHSSPAVVSHSVAAPLVSHSVYAAPYAHSAAYAAPYAHGYLHSSPLVHAW